MDDHRCEACGLMIGNQRHMEIYNVNGDAMGVYVHDNRNDCVEQACKNLGVTRTQLFWNSVLHLPLCSCGSMQVPSIDRTWCMTCGNDIKPRTVPAYPDDVKVAILEERVRRLEEQLRNSERKDDE